MNDQDIDYEHMDDLPLLDHIEWQFFNTETDAQQNNYEMEWLTV